MSQGLYHAPNVPNLIIIQRDYFNHGIFNFQLACFIILGTMSSVINCSPDHHHLFPKQQQVLHNRPILPTSRFSPSHPHGRLQRFHEGFRRSFRKPQRRLIGAPGRLFRKTPLNTKPFIP
ncbi:Hypothetical protein FKW44_018344, partial [Caligus rogercresseyi]